MFQLAFIFFVILLLKITTFACEWSTIEASFLKHFQTQTQGLKCSTYYVSKSKDTVEIVCSNRRTYTVHLEKNSFSTIVKTRKNEPYLTQCYLTGVINNQCHLTDISNNTCKTWNLSQK